MWTEQPQGAQGSQPAGWVRDPGNRSDPGCAAEGGRLDRAWLVVRGFAMLPCLPMPCRHAMPCQTMSGGRAWGAGSKVPSPEPQQQHRTTPEPAGARTVNREPCPPVPPGPRHQSANRDMGSPRRNVNIHAPARAALPAQVCFMGCREVSVLRGGASRV